MTSRFSFALSVFLLSAVLLTAQTGTTGSILGTITDPTGAAIPAAAVEIVNTANNLTQKQAVNAEGQFVFPSVPPGTYRLTATATGFRSSVISEIKVEVTKSYRHEVKLEVGQLAETVEVKAEAQAELQTIDATIGTVIPGKALPTMPLFTRRVNELLLLQPGTTPTGEITGARNDQTTFTLDGIDVSDNNTGAGSTSATNFFLGVEAIDEFRVSVAQSNASFGRGSGGQVSLISKRGGSDYHGAAYWYHQNDNLNANSWTNNRTRVRKAELKDNRYGFSLGGPVLPALKNKTFFFANFDGRRFPNASTQTRLVPLPSLRQGILRFNDASGNVNSYNLANSQACGAAGNTACDPRGLGLSPTIAAMWARMPAANDFSQGDGLNTAGFTSNVSIPLTYDAYAIRVDHNLSQNWRLDAAIRYFSQLQTNNTVLGIVDGNMTPLRSQPTRQNFETIGVSGMFKPNLTADFRFGRTRNRAGVNIQRPNESAALLNIPGTQTPAGAIALDIGGLTGTNSLLAEPFDVGTQVARKQIDDGKIYQFNSDLNWIKDKHTFQFGFHFRNLPTLHQRDDKVFGSLGALVGQIDSGFNVSVPSSSAPPTCSGSITTGCLRAADAAQWNKLFAGATGMLDSITVMAVRDGSFQPLPFGSLLESDTSGIRQPEFYWQDVWRIKPTLTLTFGLNYGWQTAPSERLGRYTVQTDARTGKPITADSYFKTYRETIESGSIFGPEFAFVPIKDYGGPVFKTDWGTLSPRLAVSWNPAATDGIMGKVFGNRKTVFRAGYNIVYDRQNTIQSVVIPSLGVAFAQTLSVIAPNCNVSNAAAAGCNATSTNPVLSSYRVGRDGTIPVPVVPAQSNPVTLRWGGTSAARYPETASFQIDPEMKIGRNHAIDFTIQREVKGDMIVEASYVGRYASRLPQGMNLLQAPYLQVDRTAGQSFAQAFDNVANALRSGATTAPAQPFFERNMPGGTAAFISRVTPANIRNGSVSTAMQEMDIDRMRAGLQPFNNYMAQMAMLRSSTGRSNYNGLLLTLRKRPTRGLFFETSYTWSKSLDQLGRNQNSANVMPNSLNLDAEYGPSEFDVTHVFQAFGGYELPFKTSLPVLKHIVRGWNISNIFTARSGAAAVVSQGVPIWGGGTTLAINSAAIPLVDPSSFGHSAHAGVAGSNNTGTTGNPAAGGSGLNIFGDPNAVFNSFRRVNIASDTRSGRGMPLRGMPRWNLDSSIVKTTRLGERVNLRLGMDFFNIFNHVDFADPALSLLSQTSFGVITAQFVPTNRSFGSRALQASARIDF